MLLRTSLAAGLLLSGAQTAISSTYSMSDLVFQTAERQSTWAPGTAAELSDTIFAGAIWDTGFTTGEIEGAVSTTTITDFTYSTRLAAWNACRNSFLSGLCGSRPQDGSFTVTTDTRTGVKADVETSGKAGFDLNYTLGAGSMAARLEYDVSAIVPDAGTVRSGEAFNLATSSTLRDGTIDQQSPTAEASVDAVLRIDASATATGCVIFIGCATGSGTILDVNEDRELVAIDLNRITYLDGFTPSGVDFSTNLANQTATLQVGTGGVVVDAPGIPKPPGVYADLGAVEVSVPLFQEIGGLVGDSLVVNGRGDFLDVTADLDTLFGLPGGFSTSFGPLGVSLDAYDFDAGPSVDLFQDLRLTPTLMVDFDFSRPVEIAGALVDSFTSAWDALPSFRIFGETTFSPTFYVDAILESVSGLQVGLELSMEFLKAHLGLSAFNFELLGLDLGPLFEQELAFDPGWGKFTIFEDRFLISGLNTRAGDAFTISPFVSPGPAQVPLPLGLPLLVSALGGLALMRRRGARGLCRVPAAA